MTREIPLTQGRIALVDDADYEWLSQRKWCFEGRYAACRHEGHNTYMHRMILNAPRGAEVDHCDGNKLNNQRSNLRLTTRGSNVANAPKRTARVYQSQYKGVYKNRKTWRVSFSVNGKSTDLGSFATETEAAKAYDAAARARFGEFAYLNFPEE